MILHYDRDFRKLRAANAMNCDVFHHELHLSLSMHARPFSGGVSASSPKQSGGVQKGFCFAYKYQNKLAKQQIVHFGTHCALTTEMEEEIVRHVVDLQDAMFPITKADLQRLAFQLAERNGLSTAFSKNKGIAGQKWYAGFLKRHPELSLRRPEATSLARADGFNKEAVNKYFRNVNEIVTKHKLDGTKVYNMDETGLNTVQRPSQAVCLKGKKRTGALTSAERGVNTTCVICTNAAGNYIPPFLIFKRKRMNPLLQNCAPVGAVCKVSDSGYINSELFVEYLQHFIAHVKPSSESPVLLVLDGHSSHTNNLEAIELARESGVIMLSLPAHTTHRTQPLDVAFFRPLKVYYNQAIEKWLRTNDGRSMTVFQVASLLCDAYNQAATLGCAKNGFEKCGLWPVNPDVFHETDFVRLVSSEEECQTGDNIPADTSVDSASVQNEC